MSSVFLFRGNGGESASGAVKGEGGPVSFGVGSVRRLFFVLRRAGGSQLPACEGGRGVSQLWSLVVVLLSVFVLGGAGGQSASGL